MDNLVLFDLDGVIASEEAYWGAAGLVLHELLHSPRYWDIDHTAESYRPAATAEESYRMSRATLPEAVIVDFKAHSINSNWDTCYVAVCLSLIHLLALLPDCSPLLPLRPAEADWITAFRRQLAEVKESKEIGQNIFRAFDLPAFQGCVGLEILDRLNAYASGVLGYHIEGVFGRYSPSWLFCQNLFQEWYLGEELYAQEYGHPPAQLGKPGCIHFERPLLPVAQIRSTLETLRTRGYRLGVVTGRPRQEGIIPLKDYGLLRYFDERHICMHDEVARAEDELRAKGDALLLSKPHPYPFLLAADPDYRLSQKHTPPRGSFIVVGDTTSDVQGGRAAGALTVAVLTGARTARARALLEQSKPDFIIDDMTKLPELLTQIDSLATIQRLQFTDRQKAELLLQRWFALYMNLGTESVTLTPKAVSLNSFNGFYRADGEEYFFKTHIEEQGVLEEYYHAELLHNAGYNIVRPLRTLHEQGRQMVIYPVVRWPVMFDLVRAVEMGNTKHATIEMLVAAEKRECERLLDIYQEALKYSTAEEHAYAPIHQLFWYRLTAGRLKNFYSGKQMLIPRTIDEYVPFDKLLRYKWSVNGAEQKYPLGELIERAKIVLNPAQTAMTVIGHGDAHFGNVFLEEKKDYLYFDPAFAGRHSPLLDVIKPLFHNVFATWMYFPHDVEQGLSLDVLVQDQERTIVVEHTYDWSPIRQAILQTKMDYLLKPLIEWLRSIEALPENWLEIMQSALMCCPLLTVNLIDRQRFPAVIGWLGFTLAVLMGNNGMQSWREGIDR